MISVIIPTLNEASNLPGVLAALDGDGVEREIIVVDGGSTDGTWDIARRQGVRVIETVPGRGNQLRAGAEAATGDVLWFLHADCRVASGALAAIGRELAATPNAPGGNFRLLFDGDDEFSRWLDGFYARIRAKGVYYGDSGVFVRRSAYETLGGIRPLALMEDYDFNRRLEGLGPTLMIENPPLVTSSRRFAGRQKWDIVMGWLVIHGLFHLGVPAPWLARLYDSTRRRHKKP
jgi:rSAM/selenodomain-associated transferase 2